MYGTIARGTTNMKRVRYRISLALASTIALASCATSSHVLVGTARPAISPDRVTVLQQAPEKFVEIAEVEASSGASLRSAQEKWDRAIETLRKEAARLGANAIVLEVPQDRENGVGGVSYSQTATTSGGRPVELNLGSSGAVLTQSVRGLAIYVPE